jgi:oligoribonuclease NrnB/cAMP/cGMP phosphodiesterase (DHH superfamily)
MKCFYHSADLDGHCSGAIVKYTYPECEMIGINYGQEFPWKSISPGEKVFMVDFTLQPFDQMEELKRRADLIWIDHHKTAIDERDNHNSIYEGIQRIGIGACALVWEYLHGKAELVGKVGEAIQLLAEYDVWNHTNPKTLAFQYGFRMFENTYPDNQELWKEFIEPCERVDEVVDLGKNILIYESRQNAKFCSAYSFESDIQTGRGVKFKAICCNRGFTNSQLFDSVWDPEKYDLMITFCRLKPPAHKWTVSMYTTKPGIDCGVIAKSFGGGGHVGAAGFQCKNLPFKY